jgi:hypothetical protein
MRTLSELIIIIALLIILSCYSCVNGNKENTAPVADAGLDQEISTGSQVTLDGSGSYDPDGDPLTHLWEFFSKPAGSQATLSDETAVSPTFTADLQGDYIFNLIVNDGIEDSPSDQLSVWAFRQVTLPDTGQETSYTDTFGEDSDYSINPPSYNDNGDGTVTDNLTGLMWQQEDSDENNCKDLELAGYSDWRLPTLKELLDIVDYGMYLPSINSAFFPGTTSSAYLSNRIAAWDSNYVWVVDFDMGYAEVRHPFNGYVRCVRPYDYYYPPTGEKIAYAYNNDGTVTHLVSGLMWQQGEGGNMNWESAINYCENLELAGYSDWRLPNIKELKSLVIYTEWIVGWAILNIFPEIHLDYYCSSTSNPLDSDYIYYVEFGAGKVNGGFKSNPYWVRCVRGGE